jgi:hypothetical protein
LELELELEVELDLVEREGDEVLDEVGERVDAEVVSYLSGTGAP